MKPLQFLKTTPGRLSGSEFHDICFALMVTLLLIVFSAFTLIAVLLGKLDASWALVIIVGHFSGTITTFLGILNKRSSHSTRQ